jgi:shikimate kinase
MRGRARAPAAGTVLNALATGTGSAFAIDEYVRATVELGGQGVSGRVEGDPAVDTSLVERCVALATAEFGDGRGGTVTTESDVPLAAGLKSSSAAANATVLATVDALGKDVDRTALARLGVRAARDVGVTVTGAFDDASASMLGGVTVTNNDEDELLVREEFDRAAVVWTPPERAYSADADVARCRRVAPLAETVADLALGGAYGRAMTVNGFAYCAALGFPTEPLLEALPAAEGVSLSGTGPSYVAVGERAALEAVRDAWAEREGRTWLTETQTEGATITGQEGATTT